MHEERPIKKRQPLSPSAWKIREDQDRPIVNLDIEIPFEMVNRIKQQIVIRHGLGELGSPSTPADELLIIVGQKLQEMGY